MAPVKGAKRAASASAGGQKRARAVKSEHECVLDTIAKEVGHAVGLPPACRLMLEGALPNSLGVPKDERLACQSRVVEMIADALAGLRDEKSHSSDGASLRVAELGEQEVSLARAVGEAEGALTAKREELEACRAQAAEADALLAGKRAALNAVVEAQRLGDMEQKAAAEECAAAEGVVQTSLSKLIGGHCEGASDTKMHLDEVESLAGKVKLQDSLLVSLRSALGKTVGERGGFDVVVAQEAEKSFRDEVARLQGVIADLGRTSAERASAVESARAEVAAAEDVVKERAAAVEEARAGERECEAAREGAAKRQHDFTPVLSEAKRAHDRAEREFRTFLEGPFAAFEKLRDRVANAPEEVSNEPSKKGEDATDFQRLGTECTSAGA